MCFGGGYGPETCCEKLYDPDPCSGLIHDLAHYPAMDMVVLANEYGEGDTVF